jgi:phage protein D
MRVTNKRFVVARRYTPRSAARVRRSTAFLFRLSEDARVTIKIRSKRRTVATLARPHSRAGRNRVGFTGRVRGRALRPGRYRATVQAIDAAGNRSTPRSVDFVVVRR